ncbi:hypothetical protein Vqi01_09920 [Micromonospora qiuiae]|uniref:HTH araC/xylS-type domain-containing protein n=1 Tax=Micromonospora qiuiae TaxID=502268 RepID=A0ABQ4J6N1_9ACTN|nr:hypothetical protein Vqi01_09920 [Micromonospora qiuiae]
MLDEIAPYIRSTPYGPHRGQRTSIRPADPRVRRFRPLRAEARQAREALHSDITQAWSLPELAMKVHLSSKQLSRVFVAAYGKPLLHT